MSNPPPFGGKDSSNNEQQEAPTSAIPKIASPNRRSSERISPASDSVSVVNARLATGSTTSRAQKASGAAKKVLSRGGSESVSEKSFIGAKSLTSSSSTPKDKISSSAVGPVRAPVQVRWVDPWTVLKVTAAVMVLLFFAWMIGVAILYVLLEAIGVVGKINSGLGDFSSMDQSHEIVTPGMVFGLSALVGLVNVILITALATVGAFIYNLCVDLTGGVVVTLTDPD